MLAVFLAVVGFLVIAQMRSRQPLRQAAGLPSWRLQEVAVLVRHQEEARRRLEQEVADLRRRATEYEAAVVEGRGLTEAMARELRQYRLALGLLPVEGPGVLVVLAEVEGGRAGVLPITVEAQDLSGLANELWSAGAEAMAINGVRVLASTGVRQAPRGLVVGTTLVFAPYRIEAIGDPATLLAALAIRGGFVEGLRSVGLTVETARRDRLRLGARAVVEPFRHARPRPGE